jgi:chromatin assembly factor 1 subunit A
MMSVSHNSLSPSLKRDHDSFSSDTLENLDIPYTADSQFINPYASQAHQSVESEKPSLVESLSEHEPSPTHSRRSSTTSLSEIGSTVSMREPSPVPDSAPTSQSAFAALNGSAPPPSKKKKLTFQEKELERINKEIKAKERAEEKARKDAEKEQKRVDLEADKVAKEEIKRKRDEEKRAKDAEKRRKEEEKLKKDEEKRIKDEEKRLKVEAKKLKDEEKLRAEEEKKKKEGKQRSLTAFFQKPSPAGMPKPSGNERTSMSPAPFQLSQSIASPGVVSPSRPMRSAYQKQFPAFYQQANVTLAPKNRFERDEEATECLEHTLDAYLLGDRSPGRRRFFDATPLFHLSGKESARGRRFMSVREIMAEHAGNSSKPIDLTTDSQNSQIRKTVDTLKKVPLKFLRFQEDVRPPYIGTYTSQPIHGFLKLARNPLRRDLPNTDYDYDSEAEWVEDDGEDVHSDGEEEEMDNEDGEDMDGFLDDENDESPSRRLVLQGDLESVSSGMCWVSNL